MKVICPKCGHELKLKRKRDPEKEPVVVCTKCKTAFFPETAARQEMDTFDDDRTPIRPSSDRFRDRQRQAKRYLVLLVLLLAVFVLYQWYNSFAKVSPWEEARGTAARALLKDVAAAQELYYAETGEYTGNPEVLSAYYLDRVHVTVDIIHAGKTAWAAKAYHERSPYYFLYDSMKGGLRPDRFPKSQRSENQEKKGAE